MKLALKFAPLAFVLAGCATTSQFPNAADTPEGCMETRNSSALNGAFTSNSTSWNEDCAQAQAAFIFSQMQTADGRPDITGQAVAVQMYLDANEDVQRSFDRMLGARGMTFNDLVQRVRTENGPVCEPNGAGQFICA